ncbi:hypothetical protein KSF78_0009533 [Schistosoma japonicum]|nr:hypothetical protein KSF78_0009533 [Schistosoma japonicum]
MLIFCIVKVRCTWPVYLHMEIQSGLFALSMERQRTMHQSYLMVTVNLCLQIVPTR